MPLCERSGDVANRNIVVILSGSTYGYIRRYNVPAFSEAGIESIRFRSSSKRIFLQRAVGKRLFQCYHMEHSRKSCRQQNIPKRTIKRNEGALRPKMAAALLLVLFGKNMEVGSQSQTTVSLAGRIAPDDEHSGCYHRPRHLQSRSLQTRPQCRFPGVSDRQTDCRFAQEIHQLAESAG